MCFISSLALSWEETPQTLACSSCFESLCLMLRQRGGHEASLFSVSVSAVHTSTSMSLQQRCLYTHSLVLVVTLLLLTATSGDSDAVENITAVLGHSVTFRCPLNHSTPVDGLYIQRDKNDKPDDFINGFYRGQPIKVLPEYKDRTKVNETELSVEMRNISVSDEGLYKCVVIINKKPEISMILLKVTAEYSVPTITKDCSKPGDGGAGKSCQLSCSAVGGYPQSTVRWTGLNQSLTNVIYNRSSADNESKTWTINQTITHNCDQPANISCAVGGAVSHTITICETESFPSVVIAAITVVFVFLFLLLIFVVVMKYFFRGRQTSVTGYEAPGAGEVGDSSK
ncbi:T-lymphocyte activation antigen CD80 isoform X3 [Carassius gibelio]|uniref:T-lymphocyte activation antigen CD80 isoform X3 n=1 Tax=Carassius gibelio TaxID=101364 RepID=UPI0022777EE4|nr:T-lymphocyte activation antigen CD80 isoform X3 [Carassius gibelio]XP_052431956.1 T-lymphocyte activation antigen CD80 isoform X3 [Carassius gibelio]